MKKLGMGMLILAVAAMVGSAVIAQPPGGGSRPGDGERRGAEGERGRGDGPPPRREGDLDGERRGDFDGPPPRRDGGEGGRGDERGFGPPPNPLMVALDTNRDHEISAEEIKNAARALASLDKNKDGKLSQDELRPERGPGGFDGPPPRRDGEGRPGEGGAGRGPGGNPGEFLDRVMSFDEDKDGKLSRKEIPERMQRMLDRGDTNKDGALDREELQKMFEQFRDGQGGQDGRPPRDGERPPRNGDRPPRDGNPDGGERPRRPAADE